MSRSTLPPVPPRPTLADLVRDMRTANDRLAVSLRALEILEARLSYSYGEVRR